MCLCLITTPDVSAPVRVVYLCYQLLPSVGSAGLAGWQRCCVCSNFGPLPLPPQTKQPRHRAIPGDVSARIVCKENFLSAEQIQDSHAAKWPFNRMWFMILGYMIWLSLKSDQIHIWYIMSVLSKTKLTLKVQFVRANVIVLFQSYITKTKKKKRVVRTKLKIKLAGRSQD